VGTRSKAPGHGFSRDTALGNHLWMRFDQRIGFIEYANATRWGVWPQTTAAQFAQEFVS
jgi:hypothetical protein